jgi:DNA-directed RNA polymerase subunit RPC12/RpoP
MSEKQPIEHFQFACKECGFELDYGIGKNSLVCQSCGQVEAIEVQEFNIFHAHPYDTTAMQLVNDEPSEVHHHVRCNACGAGFDLAKDTHADECPFCSSNVVVPVDIQRQLRPDAVLPFLIDDKVANEAFKKWLKSLWFAPNSLKRLAMKKHPIQGTYIPYWAFDADTFTRYTGQRGDNYTTTVSMPTVVNGRTVMKQQTVVKIRWRSVSGSVSHEFDNVLITGSELLPQNLTSTMKQWRLDYAKVYNPKYLSGFKSELYQVGLPRGLRLAKHEMTAFITRLVRMDIGGDHQRISSQNTQYDRVGFKLMLMPLWVSAFLYNRKTYRFIVNGQTGMVKGDRPYSVIKIVSFIVFIGSLVFGAYMLHQNGVLG